ncbi:MAG: type IV pilin protein [Pseudomonadota bacterium]|nr:type IV pilin protein [Pseudomonadota bacterium]
MRKSRRADAARSIGQLQLELERWRAENPCYGTTPNPPCAILSGTYPTPTVSDFYAIAITAAAPTAYTITATPTGAQTGDRCKILTATRDSKPTWETPACN